jgi:N-acetylglucosaminyldiphosphoundecaprenol N-acetyl-beta-D-mannosaminyltransferase
MNTFTVFGLTFFSGSIAEVVDRVDMWIEANIRTYVCVTGAHGVVEAHDKPAVLRAHQEAKLVVPDGMPLVWIGKAMGHRKTERIYGPDLFLALCRRAQEEKWGVFFYGCTTSVLAALSRRLHEQFPKLIIAGSYAPPFRALTIKESKEIVRAINTSGARIVFVGLSTPKQELWMQYFSRKLHANVLVGVGAAFDFFAGTRRQAPRWIQRSGFEWLFRLAQEPRRLWYRYTVQNIYFLLLTTKAVFISFKR